ncbi:hypothetical protein B0H10DRAFT_1976762 [Mycena sp. CBHHK59/15]|nr:hypothetical protein B0H10DRAFT_1976762 [Mycena sp. CBHHK59/15]
MASVSKNSRQSDLNASPRRPGSLTNIWQWTFTPDAVASCFVQDVYNMPENGVKDAEFFWLGRVPCRSVKLVGMLVGVQTYETRVVYSLDDGTAVIECQHRPPAPSKPKLDKTKPETQQPLLEPLAYVGYSVTIIGRIVPWHDTRRILVDSMVQCVSANDEPNHWIAVRALHETHYSLKDPFVLPLRPSSQDSNAVPVVVPVTPFSSASTPSSPLKSLVKSPTSSHASPHKLRHPSRLHTADLTSNAFRIYLKHYMDNADDDVQLLVPEPSTPTKSSRKLPLGEETPRPHQRIAELTPRRVAPLDFTRSFFQDDPTRGFTVSHLRRVPELALMAKRVVKAEAKRRAREARRKANEAALSQKPSAPVVTSDMRKDLDKLHPRMKRLFNWAILQLIKEGDVIPWDGPVRPSPEVHSSRTLWQLNSSVSTIGGNSTTVSIAEDDEDEGELTDPEPDEEVFVSLTPAFLATTVEKSIATLTARATKQAQASDNPNRPRTRAPAAGPTVQEIARLLKRDDMWRNLTDFAVEQSLALLQDEGRAWTIGGGRWELSI